MTTQQATKLTAASATQIHKHVALVAAWEKRRPWTRTDTARFLDERSEPILALLRRVNPERAPLHSRQMGYWLKDNATAAFNRAHEKLASAANDDARERLLPSELL